MQTPNDITADELAWAYRSARLRYVGVTLTTALTNPLIYKSLCLQVLAHRNHNMVTDSRMQQVHNRMEAA